MLIIQPPLFLEDRTRYLVKYKSKVVKVWYMGGLFISDNYHTAKDLEVLERIGNEKEIFG